MGMFVDEFRVLVYVDGSDFELSPRTTILHITVKNHIVASVQESTPERIRGTIGVVTTDADFTAGVLCMFYSLKSSPTVVRVGIIDSYKNRGIRWLSKLSSACVEPVDDINDVLTVMEFV